MAFQALYRKYRPSSFEEVVGQTQIVQTLKNAVDSQRIAHAYLFCGPRGTGKTSIAKIFARTLNCTGEKKPCMECENCRLSLNGSHPDIIEIDAASNNGVDEVRSLIDRISYAPMEGKWKVYIIDEVHMMTTGAFNALLKTIEEPPAHVVFILATTEPNKVLPTILSRCQRFDFKKVSVSDITGRIQDVCKQENLEIDEEAAHEIAVLADGGMRDALSILDQCIAYSPQKVTIETIRSIYGILRKEDLGELMLLLNEEHAGEAAKKFHEIEDAGADLKRFVTDFSALLKNSMLYELSPQTDLISESEKEILKKYFSPVPIQKRMNLITDLMELLSRISFITNLADYIETVLLKSAFAAVTVKPEPSYERSSASPKKGKPHSDHKSEKERKSDISSGFKEKTPLHSDIPASDVSRETFRKTVTPIPEILFDSDTLLSMLVGADKKERNSDEIKMRALSQYEHDLDVGKLAVSLQHAQILASAENYLLMVCRSKTSSEEVNELQNTVGYEKFMEQVLGKRKRIYAIPMAQKKPLIQEFITRTQDNSLPAAFKLDLASEEEQKEPEINEEEFLRSVFPTLSVIAD